MKNKINISSELYNNTLRQLKNINFVLLTLASVMVVFVFLSTKPKIEIAIDDLNNLKSAFEFDPKVKPKPLYGTAWLDELTQKEIKKNQIKFDKYYYEENKVNYRLNYETRMLPSGPNFSYDKGLKPQFYFDGSISIIRLKELWNGISRIEKIVYVKSLSDYMAIYNKDQNKFIYQKTSFSKSISGQYAPTGKLSLVTVGNEEWINSHFSKYGNIPSVKEKLVQMTHKPNVSSPYYIFGNLSSISGFDFRSPGTHSVPADKWEEYEYSQLENAFSGKIFIPVITDKIVFYPQKSLLNSVPEDFGWKLGSFALNFIELDELTKGYQDIPIAKIKIILEKELERSSGSVISAFGLSIPFSIVSKFGVFAILIVQIYFLLYLVYLYRYFDNEENLQLEVAWVFMHKNIFAVIAFFIVSILYPALIAIYFSWVNISSSAITLGMSAHIILLMVEIVLFGLLTKYVFSFSHMNGFIKDIKIKLYNKTQEPI